MVRPAEIALPFLIRTGTQEPPRARTLAFLATPTVAGHRAAVCRDGKPRAALPERESRESRE